MAEESKASGPPSTPKMSEEDGEDELRDKAFTVSNKKMKSKSPKTKSKAKTKSKSIKTVAVAAKDGTSSPREKTPAKAAPTPTDDPMEQDQPSDIQENLEDDRDSTGQDIENVDGGSGIQDIDDDTPSVGNEDEQRDAIALGGEGKAAEPEGDKLDRDEDEDEDAESGEGPKAHVLGEEDLATIKPGPRLKRQVSAAGAFNYRAYGSRASDRFKQSVRRIETNQWDTDAWELLVNEARYNGGGGMGVRDVLRKFIKQFPTSGRYRRMLVEAELNSGDWQTADKVLYEGLERCASLELWLLYLERARRSAAGASGGSEQEARAAIIAAFELALQHMGHNPSSTLLWQEYLSFIKSWEERSPLDKGNKMTSLRKVYQRVVCRPVDGIERLWRECEEFEMAGNEHLWKNKFSIEYMPKYNAARAVVRERKQAWDGIHANFLAKPPTAHDEKQATQYKCWKRRIAYEKGNPELVDEDGLRARVRHSYAQCLSHLRHFCEIWYDLAEYEYSLGDGDRAAQVYRQAVEVIPASDLLRVAQADLAERRGKIDDAEEMWQDFLADRHSTTGHVMYLRFVRRNMGKEAARRAFGRTRLLRKSGAIDYRLYLTQASIELHVNGEPEVARRVLEHGLSQHESYISEPKYVLAYIEFLVQRNEEDNLRVLFERVLDASTMPMSEARPIWERFVELEFCLTRSGGSLLKAQQIEGRMQQVFMSEPGASRGLAALWRRCSVAGCGTKPEGEVDSDFRNRVLDASTDDKGQGDNSWQSWGKDTSDLRWPGDRRDTNFPGQNGASWGNFRNQPGGVGPQGDGRLGVPGGAGGPTSGGGGDGDEGWSRGDSSLSPLIPPFLMKLYMSLPRHMGPQPDADGLLKALRERALPDKPSAGDDSRRGGKRRRVDSDDEEGAGAGGMEAAPHKKPVRDIFRQRMQANLQTD